METLWTLISPVKKKNSTLPPFQTLKFAPTPCMIRTVSTAIAGWVYIKHIKDRVSLGHNLRKWTTDSQT